jgi:hypothetical protein
VDRFNNLFVTAYVTPGNARFLLLHEGKNDDSIRSFFTEVYELYLRVSRRVCWSPASQQQRAGGRVVAPERSSV